MQERQKIVYLTERKLQVDFTTDVLPFSGLLTSMLTKGRLNYCGTLFLIYSNWMWSGNS